MQSEAWKDAIVDAQDKQYGDMVASLADIADQFEEEAANEIASISGGSCGADGLGPSTADLVESGQICLVSPLTPEDYIGQPC